MNREYMEFASFCFGLTAAGYSEDKCLEYLKELYPDAKEYEVKVLVECDENFSGLTGREVFFKVDELETIATLH